jgi:predicted ATPase/DNA-binding SARP family transcriptional activator
MDFGILGPLEVHADGRPVPLGGPMPRSVLAVLLLHGGGPVSPERLAVALWGEDAPPDALAALRVHVSRLRKALGDAGMVARSAAGYRLALDPEALDARRFERLAAEGRDALRSGDPAGAAELLRRALALWRGPVLADLPALGGVDAARLEEQRLSATEARLEAELALGRRDAVIAELEALVAEHPTRERAAAQLMLALYRDGRQAEALDVFRRTREYLAEELGLEPGPALRAMQEQILRQDEGLAGAPEPAARPRIPVPATATVGRRADIEEVAGRLRGGGERLITLVGPGGVGKTRVAMEASRALGDAFPDGVHFVPLAAVAEPMDVAAATARALSVHLMPRETPREGLCRFLEAKRTLLVLDNFEHVIPASELVAELLEAAPSLAVMATSREPLALAEEARRPILPLPAPEAVELFAARAGARDPEFTLGEHNRDAVWEICARLDGLPLAVELAAARMELLSAPELAERLRVALGDLGAAGRGAPERQRTLEATVAWSYGLLEPGERRAFAAFSVFSGGATVDACEVVLGTDLETLQSLVAKSLLVRGRSADGRTRIGMLETIREFARGRVEDEHGLRERHAAWHLAYAREHGSEPALYGADRPRHLERMDAEHDNVVAAVRWAVESGELETAWRLAAAAGTYWYARSRYDLLPWVERSLTPAEGASPARVRAMLEHAVLLWPVGRVAEQPEALAGATALARAIGDRELIAECLTAGAESAVRFGEWDAARRRAAEARELGDAWTAAKAGVWSVQALEEPDFDELDQIRGELVAVGNLEYLCVLLYSVAYWISSLPGHAPSARGLIDEAGHLADLLESEYLRMMVSGNRGLVLLFTGEHDAADAAFRTELGLSHRLVVPAIAREALFGLGAIAAAGGDDRRAARLHGAHGEAGYESRDRTLAAVEAAFFDPARARSASWETDHRDGARLGLWGAVAEALG